MRRDALVFPPCASPSSPAARCPASPTTTGCCRRPSRRGARRRKRSSGTTPRSRGELRPARAALRLGLPPAPRRVRRLARGARADGAALWNPAAARALERSTSPTCGRSRSAGSRRRDRMARARIVARRCAALMDARGWRDVVVKPAVSASAHRTFRVARDGRRARDRRTSTRSSRTATRSCSRSRPRSRRDGEWSLLFFGGAFSHAVRKRPAAADFRVQEELGGRAETDEPGAERDRCRRRRRSRPRPAAPPTRASTASSATACSC